MIAALNRGTQTITAGDNLRSRPGTVGANQLAAWIRLIEMYNSSCQQQHVHAMSNDDLFTSIDNSSLQTWPTRMIPRAWSHPPKPQPLFLSTTQT